MRQPRVANSHKKVRGCFNELVGERDSVTHLVGLSKLVISAWIHFDRGWIGRSRQMKKSLGSPLKDPAIFLMRWDSDCPSFAQDDDCWGEVCSSHGVQPYLRLRIICRFAKAEPIFRCAISNLLVKSPHGWLLLWYHEGWRDDAYAELKPPSLRSSYSTNPILLAYSCTPSSSSPMAIFLTASMRSLSTIQVFNQPLPSLPTSLHLTVPALVSETMERMRDAPSSHLER